MAPARLLRFEIIVGVWTVRVKDREERRCLVETALQYNKKPSIEPGLIMTVMEKK